VIQQGDRMFIFQAWPLGAAEIKAMLRNFSGSNPLRLRVSVGSSRVTSALRHRVGAIARQKIPLAYLPGRLSASSLELTSCDVRYGRYVEFRLD
jgi:hypothetical protein